MLDYVWQAASVQLSEGEPCTETVCEVLACDQRVSDHHVLLVRTPIPYHRLQPGRRVVDDTRPRPLRVVLTAAEREATTTTQWTGLHEEVVGAIARGATS